MSSKIINTVVVLMLSIFVVDSAKAGLIVGNIYTDSQGSSWEYIDSFDLSKGERYKKNNIVLNVKTYNGLEAAELLFGPLTANSIYAISSEKFDEYMFFNGNLDGFVNHKAWYDSFGQNGSVKAYNEDRTTDNAGAAGYNAVNDFSAYVNDRATAGNFMNHVFKSVVTSVPEPSTIVLFSLAVFGLLTRRLKQ